MSNGTVACPQVFPQFNTQAKPLPVLYALTSEGKSRELLKLAAQFAVKRILDYIGAGLGVLLLGPLMLGIASCSSAWIRGAPFSSVNDDWA